MHDSDERLRTELAGGRPDAVAALYDRFAAPLFRVAWTMLRSRSDAEDAVHEVFVGVMRAGASLARVNDFRAYLFAALRHAVARIGGRRRPAEPAGAEVPAPEAAGDDVDPVLFGQLERGLAALPPEQREVVALKIDGGLTFAEIAAVLGLRPNTAASRYRYALEKLRAALKEDDHDSRSASRPARA